MKRRGLLSILTLPAFVALVLVGGASAQEEHPWVVEMVDPVGGRPAAVVLDADGRPQFYYWVCQSNGRFYECDLKHALHDDGAWQIETLGSFGDVREDNLVFDPAGRPHIVFCEFETRSLQYARFDGTAWITQTVVRFGYLSSFALDQDERPHVSYSLRTYFDREQAYRTYPRYTYFDGTTWISETVDNGAGESSSLALDAGGHPRIAYEGYMCDLNYAHNDGMVWITETVDSEGMVGDHPSLVLDAEGRPHISYDDYTNGDLKYAYLDDSGWHVETADSYGRVGWESYLVLDAFGRPHISHYRFNVGYNGYLKYTYYDGVEWRSEIVEGEAELYSTESVLAVDSAGRPHIGYCANIGNAQHALMYAFRASPLPRTGVVAFLLALIGAGALIVVGWIIRLVAQHRRPVDDLLGQG